MIPKKTILLADDDEDDRDLFREALNNIGYDCELIMMNNGEKVIDFFTNIKTAPDFIFLDINMPRINGIECLKFIKANYPSNNFHVIMLSTATGLPVVEQSDKNGASLYIQKPSRFNDLTKYISYCLMDLQHASIEEEFILNKRLKDS